MLVKKWMSKPVISIESDASLMDASNLFRKKIISMLPVTQDGKLVGIVTDGDIKKASPSEATSLDIYELMSLVRQIKITQVMSSPVATISGDCTVDEAAAMMLRKNISGMPVLDDKGQMIGVITKSDIFRCLVSFTGIANKGQVFAFRIKDRPGIIKVLTDTIRQNGGRLSSILTSYDDIDHGFREVFIHSYDIAPDRFEPVVAQLHEAAQILYVADLERGVRRIY
ncbi:MAG: CBS and ACT domain-containing protein [Pseudomonadota bacterium]